MIKDVVSNENEEMVAVSKKDENVFNTKGNVFADEETIPISKEDVVHTGGNVFIIEKLIQTKAGKEILVSISNDSVAIFKTINEKGKANYLNKEEMLKVEREKDGDLDDNTVVIIEYEPFQKGTNFSWKVYDVALQLFKIPTLLGLASISINFESHLNELLSN